MSVLVYGLLLLVVLLVMDRRPARRRSHVLDSFDVPPAVGVKSMDGFPWDFED